MEDDDSDYLKLRALISSRFNNIAIGKQLTSTDNMDNIKNPGIYYTRDNIVPENIPIGNSQNAVIIVLHARQNMDIFQIYITNNSQKIFIRFIQGSSFLTGWKEISYKA